MNNENEKEEMSFEEAQAAVQQMFQQSNEEAERNALADRLEEQQIQPHRQDDEGDQMQYDALPFQPQRFKRVCGEHLVFDKVYHVAPLQ